MAIPATNLYERVWATYVILTWTALVTVGSVLPTSRAWSINHLAFLPPDAAWVFGILIAADLIAIWWSPGPDTQLHRIRLGIAPLWWMLLIILTWVVVAYLVRAATPLLGDGYLRIDEAERRSPSLFLLTDFLPGLLLTTIQQGPGQAWGWSGRDVVSGLSIISGAIFVAGAITLWPRVVGRRTPGDPSSAPHPASVFWLLTGGTVVLFFGYLETYPLAAAMLSLFALSLLAHDHQRLAWWWPILLWLLAFWTHLMAIGWAPALVLSMIRVPGTRKNKTVCALVATTAVVGSATVIWLLRGSGTPFLWHRYLLPLWSGGYSVLDVRHLVDFLNHLLLLVPILLMLMLRDRKSTRILRFGSWFWLAAPAVVFCLWFGADLGWARDWDLYALASIPGTVVLSVFFAHRQARWSRSRTVAAATIALTSLTLWTWVNTNEHASVLRFQHLLDLDSHLGTAGNENMARYWREAGRWDLAVEELGYALQKEPHARLAIQRGIGWSVLGQPDSAIVAFTKAIAYDPGLPDGFFGVGQSLWTLGYPDSAAPYFEKAVAMDPTRADYRYYLGLSLTRQQRYDAAVPHLAYAVRHDPGRPLLANALAIAHFERGDLVSAMEVLSTALGFHPANGLLRTNLARILYESGRYEDADRMLTLYENHVAPDQRLEAAVTLRRALDSLGSDRPEPR